MERSCNNCAFKSDTNTRPTPYYHENWDDEWTNTHSHWCTAQSGSWGDYIIGFVVWTCGLWKPRSNEGLDWRIT